MGKVTVIFVGGDSLVDDVIEKVTSGEYSHVAININGGILESTGIIKEGDHYPGVHMRQITEYDGNPDAVFIDVDVPDLQAAELKAKYLLGKFYSYVGCVEGGAYDVFGIKLHGWITKLINLLLVKFLHIPVNVDTGEWSMNCSETVTRILRAGGFNILPGVDADCITPMDLYRELKTDEKECITMANQNLNNFLSVVALNLLNYGAAKLQDKNTAFVPTRTAIYNAGLQILAQELQDRLAKMANKA
jgi:hypothetical protein